MTIVDKRKWQLSSCGEYYELTPKCKAEYIAALHVQTKAWLSGSSVHNDYSGECTPDVSCCGGTLWSLELRIRFINADEITQINMLMGSVEQLLSNAHLSKSTYIASTSHYTLQ